jgi:subtilisin family serine protease
MSHPGINSRGRLVLLRDGVDLYHCMSGIESQGIGRCVPMPLIGGFHCLCDEHADGFLSAHPAVSLVEANSTVNLTAIALQDPSIRQPGNITEAIRTIHAHEAWRLSQGEGVGVAVFDTGIDLTHPDLNNRVYGGINLIKPGAQPQDDHGHGTRVAGIIAATGRSPAVTGVAPKARLYAVKVLDANGDGAVSNLILGLQWVMERNIAVVNMSLDIPEESQALAAAIHKAIASGITIVASTGNRGPANPPAYPAAYPGVIGVSAVTLDGRAVSFGTAGPEVDLVAPGFAIRTTTLRRGYTWASGTSMASPFVAGVAALYLQLYPDASPEQVRDALLKSAVELPGVPRRQQGAGLVNAAEALHYTRPEAAATPVPPPQQPVEVAAPAEPEPESSPPDAPVPPAWEARLEAIHATQIALEQHVQAQLAELTRLIQTAIQQRE